MNMPLWVDFDNDADVLWDFRGDTEEFYPVSDDPALDIRIIDIGDDDDYDMRDLDNGGI